MGRILCQTPLIRKPFGKHELIARIGAALRRGRSHVREHHSFLMHDLLVYPRELRAERDGLEIELHLAR